MSLNNNKFNLYTIKNCKDCPYLKCTMRIKNNFEMCPVETAKRKKL